jgi:hypothetical protein
LPQSEDVEPVTDFIGVKALVQKIAPGQRFAATRELNALKAAFAANDLQDNTLLFDRLELLTSGTQSPEVETIFLEIYRRKIQLEERQINLYNKYGILSELDIEGKNIKEVLNNFRKDVGEIIRSGKYVQTEQVAQMASFRDPESVGNRLASILSILEPTAAFAQAQNSPPYPYVHVWNLDPKKGCDGNIYHRKKVYAHFDTDGFAKKRVFEYYVLRNHRLSRPRRVDLALLGQYVQLHARCPNNHKDNQIVGRVCDNSVDGPRAYLMTRYMATASACGCSTKPPPNDRNGEPVWDGYPGHCAYSRYKVKQWNYEFLPNPPGFRKACDFVDPYDR